MRTKLALAIFWPVALALGVGLGACVGDDPFVAPSNLADAALDDGAAAADARASDANQPRLVACGAEHCAVCCSDPTFPDGGRADPNAFQAPRCASPGKPCVNTQNSLECDRASQCPAPAHVCCAQLYGGGYTVSGGHCDLASVCDQRKDATRLCGGPADCDGVVSEAGTPTCKVAQPAFLSICKP